MLFLTSYKNTQYSSNTDEKCLLCVPETMRGTERYSHVLISVSSHGNGHILVDIYLFFAGHIKSVLIIKQSTVGLWYGRGIHKAQEAILSLIVTAFILHNCLFIHNFMHKTN